MEGKQTILTASSLGFACSGHLWGEIGGKSYSNQLYLPLCLKLDHNVSSWVPFDGFQRHNFDFSVSTIRTLYLRNIYLLSIYIIHDRFFESPDKKGKKGQYSDSHFKHQLTIDALWWSILMQKVRKALQGQTECINYRSLWKDQSISCKTKINVQQALTSTFSLGVFGMTCTRTTIFPKSSWNPCLLMSSSWSSVDLNENIPITLALNVWFLLKFHKNWGLEYLCCIGNRNPYEC